MWVECDACEGEGTCPEGCCACPVCDEAGGIEIPDQGQDNADF
jgi:hypothetical protein